MLLGSRSCGNMSHWQPLRLRYRIVFTTSRISTSRGRPPCCVRAAGISGASTAHCSSVRSEGYALRASDSFDIRVHSVASEECAKRRQIHELRQVQFSDSLLAVVESRFLPAECECVTASECC